MLVMLEYCMGVCHVGSGRRNLDLYRRAHAGLAQYCSLFVNDGGRRVQHGDLFSELIRREIDITSGNLRMNLGYRPMYVIE